MAPQRRLRVTTVGDAPIFSLQPSPPLAHAPGNRTKGRGAEVEVAGREPVMAAVLGFRGRCKPPSVRVLCFGDTGRLPVHCRRQQRALVRNVVSGVVTQHYNSLTTHNSRSSVSSSVSKLVSRSLSFPLCKTPKRYYQDSAQS